MPNDKKAQHHQKDHKKRHRELHQALDELAADFLSHTQRLLSQTSVLDLMAWSAQQMDNPTKNKGE